MAKLDELSYNRTARCVCALNLIFSVLVCLNYGSQLSIRTTGEVWDWVRETVMNRWRTL